MRKPLFCSISLFVAFASLLLAQEDVITIASPPKAQLTQRILFLVDCSGSMDGPATMARSLNTIKFIFEQPIDELEVAAIAFDNGHNRWPGLPQPPKIPANWAAFPSRNASQALSTWIGAAQVTMRGGTNLAPPLRQAFAENRDKLSIIIVTDGGFAEKPETLKKVVDDGQKWRTDRGIGPAVVVLLGIHYQNTYPSLVRLNQDLGDNSGGYFVVKTAQLEEAQ